MAMMLVKKPGHHHPCCVHGRLSNNPTTIEEAHYKTQNCNVSWSTTLKPPHPATPFVYMSHCERSELQLQMETATANPNAKIPSFCHQHRQISYIHLSRDLRSLLWWWCCLARGILDGSIVIYEYIFLHDLLDWWSVQKDSEMFSKHDQWNWVQEFF
jgi:hypothetical protein